MIIAERSDHPVFLPFTKMPFRVRFCLPVKRIVEVLEERSNFEIIYIVRVLYLSTIL